MNNGKKTLFPFLFLFVAQFFYSTESNQAIDVPKEGEYEFWLTNADRSALFQKQLTSQTIAVGAPLTVINVESGTAFQTIDRFGCTLTGGSAMLLHQMSDSVRAGLLKELFAPNDKNIGISYLRISIGSSDLDERVFTYNDLPAGQTDTGMTKFSLDPDRTHLIPILKEILAINPDIKILGSPWSAPTWMKNNNSSIGGSVRIQYYGAYAHYFVNYIQGMKNEGISIDAITIQNEPLNPENNPSMVMQAAEQAHFITQHLGPKFAANGIDTKIILYDHNADRTDYPISILNDSAARVFVNGSAFHLYGGNISDLSAVHNAHPDKHLYFTEQWIGAPGNFAGDLKWHTGNLIIGAIRNWCRTVLEWNLAADPMLNPHTPGGCTKCLGILTISGDAFSRNPAYYILAHASKFVRPGSMRIASSVPGSLTNVAFLRSDGKKVLIVLNEGSSTQIFKIKEEKTEIVSFLNAGSVGTYVW
ncbi:MAG: glycoside hydrolase family 30 beta sandwich domain-containing protein [Bacteriovoracaceae bacterium]